MGTTMILIVLAILCVLFGGTSGEASQLYYDADFVELYDTSGDDAEEGRTRKGGKPVEDATQVPARQKKKQGAIPTTLEDGVVDSRMLAEDIYTSSDV